MMLLDYAASPPSADALAVVLVSLELWVGDSPASHLAVEAWLQAVLPGSGGLLSVFSAVDPAQQMVYLQTGLCSTVFPAIAPLLKVTCLA